ncbi:unnamed protein product [Cylicocyclus nassatus]|uniref:SCP domain-containing protein n=1 Tax=Cylicocyclus nassatus TaxID=53992 RepID=A0AA36H0M0_CYLNA|nr:unnamed protein product [Cylicocyclus nassatus]
MNVVKVLSLKLIAAAATKLGCAVKTCDVKGEDAAFYDYDATVLCLTDHRLESPDYDIYEIKQDEADCVCLTDSWCNPDTKLCETTTTITTTTTTPTTTTTTTPAIQPSPNAVLPSSTTEDTRVEQCENFYQMTETGVTSFEEAASKAVNQWWKVVKVYPSFGSAAKFRDTHVGTAIITFTQMAWAATQYLGCSVVHCSPFYTTVCRYSPKGNVVGETVYAPGDFCTACPPDTKCNAALYLCAP